MSYTKQILYLFNNQANAEQARPMEKYMRHQFPFLGIKAALRKQLMREFYRDSGIKKEAFQSEFVRSLWELDEREFQYVAMDYLAQSLKKLRKHDLLLVEELITTKSWWDTVDMLAQKPVAVIARRFPEVIEGKIEDWNKGGDLWLQRSSILFQLKYKEQTSETLLYRYILSHAESGEFFIQKAIGWALREYSKTNADSVRDFIENHQLSTLSVREGSKYL